MIKILLLACIAISFVATTKGTECPIPEPECPIPQGNENRLTLLPVPTNCHQYVMCNWGIGTLMDCPVGLVFNRDLQVCDYQDNVDCIECNEEPELA